MENEKGVPEVDFPLLAHLLFYVPWDIKIFSEKKNLRAQILYFILREISEHLKRAKLHAVLSICYRKSP